MGANNVDGFLNPSTTGDDILGNQKAFAGSDREPAQDKAAIPIFLHKDVPGAEMPGDFLPNNDAADGGRDNSRLSARDLSCKGTEFHGQFSADQRGNRGILKQQRTLEKFAAM